MYINQRILIKGPIIIITIRDNKKIDEERIEKVWVEACMMLSLERKRPHCTGQYKYTIHNHMCFKSYVFLSQNTTTRQIDRVQKGSPNLMNINVLKII